jgi:thiol-disulfide isomerase/thioredoxin
MSTLRLSVVLLIILVLLGLVGCTSTSSYRTTEGAPKLRTVATIGDKPLPIVTGEPGETVTPDSAPEPPLERRPRTDAGERVSGRVIDENGEPVAGAQVRLGVSSAPGGRVVQTTTDRAGGFTLRGLRPGTSYTLIAELEDDQGVLTGRSTVQVPSADVRIALDPVEGAPRAAGVPARVSPASRRGAAEEPVADRLESSINVEDLPPPPEAESIAPSARRNPQAGADWADSPATSRPGGWRALDRSQPLAPQTRANASKNGRLPRASENEPALAPSRGAGFPPVEAPSLDDDGPNPLPPALEPGETSLSVPAARDQHELLSGAPLAPPVEPATILASADEPAALPDPTPGALVAAASPPAQPRPAPAPAPLPASGPPEPVASDDARPRLPPPIESAEPTSASPLLQAQAAFGPPSGPEQGSESEAEPEPPDRAPPPRIRWRDLAAGETGPPPLEVAGRDSPGKEPDTYCRYDSQHRRIEDFRLPDLQGRLVRFQDFDADLILLDFWGSWCQPCLRSVPHLVDLQKRLGGKQFQVIGIACERDETPVSQRVARASSVAKKLGMNYPVLMTSADGACPLQKALNVKSYPTLILVDRHGRVLWQDQGATRLSMMRLDRMISVATKGDGRRRY